MKFEYKAKTPEGEVTTGEINASSKEGATLILQNKNFYVLSLEEKKTPFYQREISILERIPESEVILFSEQLSIMLSSSIPLVESLQAISSQVSNDKFKEYILEIAQKVKEGVEFSSALSKYPQVFSVFYVNIVKAGEETGNLHQSLNYLTEYLRANNEFKKKIINAMTYPIVIMVVFGGVLVFLFAVIMPNLIGMIEDAGADIPFVTQIAINISNAIRFQGHYIFLALYCFIVAIILFLKSDFGKNIFDSIVFRIPSFGKFLKKIYLYRFAENFATLFSGGVSVVKSLEITKDIIGNNVYKDIIEQTKQGVERGEEISKILKRYPDYFPAMITQMIAVGEKTGKMSETLMSVVRIYKREVEDGLNAYVSIIEPAMIMIMGALVGGMVASVILPIYQMGLSM